MALYIHASMLSWRFANATLSCSFQTNGFATPRHDMTSSPSSRTRHSPANYSVTSPTSSSSLQRPPKTRQFSPAREFTQNPPASNTKNLLPHHNHNTTVTSSLHSNGRAMFAQTANCRGSLTRQKGQLRTAATGDYMSYGLVDSDVWRPTEVRR